MWWIGDHWKTPTPFPCCPRYDWAKKFIALRKGKVVCTLFLVIKMQLRHSMLTNKSFPLVSLDWRCAFLIFRMCLLQWCNQISLMIHVHEPWLASFGWYFLEAVEWQPEPCQKNYAARSPTELVKILVARGGKNRAGKPIFLRNNPVFWVGARRGK